MYALILLTLGFLFIFWVITTKYVLYRDTVRVIVTVVIISVLETVDI
jgi:hypothetical protein